MQHVTGPGAPPMGFGSFHQQYFLDGKYLLQMMLSKSWKYDLYTAHVPFLLLTLRADTAGLQGTIKS